MTDAEQRISMEHLNLNYVVASAVLLLCFPYGSSAEKALALFVFGDSYVDTGNHDPYKASVNEGWRRPYGFDWPGFPAGRYSSGKIQTDRWAEILGFPTPIAYEKLKTHHCGEMAKKMVNGVNFAVGGSGIFQDYGYITIAQQVQHFKRLINETRAFGKRDLGRSIVLLSNAGNDYFAYLDDSNDNVTGLVSLVTPIVTGIVDVVKELYEHGFRNFVVSDVGALGCFPEIGRTSCDSAYDEVIEFHSRLLKESVHQLRSDLKGSNIIIPHLQYAYRHIFSNPTHYGFEDLFCPCCAAKGKVTGCAEVSDRGEPLFEMCEDPKKRLFWDNRHPTHKGWHALMSLYTYGDIYRGKKLSFVKGANNLKDWVKSIGFDAHDISPISSR
uniref:SGNH hydrolase-type esterase domain-containing protein n=1 Tax=Araucaria cunninghamii TaxID=56994 RepID=A0A0D6QSW9_ARACU